MKDEMKSKGKEGIRQAGKGPSHHLLRRIVCSWRAANPHGRRRGRPRGGTVAAAAGAGQAGGGGGRLGRRRGRRGQVGRHRQPLPQLSPPATTAAAVAAAAAARGAERSGIQSTL